MRRRFYKTNSGVADIKDVLAAPVEIATKYGYGVYAMLFDEEALAWKVIDDRSNTVSNELVGLNIEAVWVYSEAGSIMYNILADDSQGNAIPDVMYHSLTSQEYEYFDTVAGDVNGSNTLDYWDDFVAGNIQTGLLSQTAEDGYFMMNNVDWDGEGIGHYQQVASEIAGNNNGGTSIDWFMPNAAAAMIYAKYGEKAESYWLLGNRYNAEKISAPPVEVWIAQAADVDNAWFVCVSPSNTAAGMAFTLDRTLVECGSLYCAQLYM